MSNVINQWKEEALKPRNGQAVFTNFIPPYDFGLHSFNCSTFSK